MTAQFSESILYNGKKLPMYTNPLSSYLTQTGIQFLSPNTANWRGYIGTWEIKGNAETGERLYLVKLAAHKSYEEILSLKDVFPESPNGVFAHWYSGTIRIPQGAQIKYVHMGYGSVYEYELYIEFNRGILINKFIKHNSPDQDKKQIHNNPSFLKTRND
jgi:hypothetical protein